MKNHVRPALLMALILIFASVVTAQAAVIPPYGEGQIGLQAVVLCEELTVREEASAASQGVRTLPYGARIIVQPETGGWAKCFLSDAVDEGPAGWVSEEYLVIDPAWYVTEDKTPVYAWNDTVSPRVALLDSDATLPILKQEGAWLLVSLRGAAGWIYDQDAAENTAGQTETAPAPAPVEAPEALPEPAPATVSETEPETAPETEPEAGLQNGDRFETAIMIEGMEETVNYEHIVSDALGLEMDYDYERFERRGEPDREYFVSRGDDSDDPQNFLEVKRSAESAEAAAASVSEALSADYDITTETVTLDRAGECVRIDASRVKGTSQVAYMLQTVYIIPAGDGCVVATVRCTIESAEGFGVRAGHMLNTLALTNGLGE